MNAIPLTIDIILGNGGYKSTNIGSGGFKPTNSKNKSQKPILDTNLKKQEEKDESLEETGSGAGRDNEDDIDDRDGDDEDNDRHGGPISPEEEEDVSRIGSINLNPKIPNKIDEDEDLTTTVESTDEISSKMKYFINFDYKSMRDLRHFQQKNYAKHIPKQFVFGLKFVHFVFPQLIFLFKNLRK